jgi:hypothetical protein
MVRFKELLGNRPAPVPPSTKDLAAARDRILSTLNAAERRIVEARYGIPSNVDTSAGVPITDEMEVKGTMTYPAKTHELVVSGIKKKHYRPKRGANTDEAYKGMMKASDVYCPKGYAWKLLSPESCQLECGVICEKGWRCMGGGTIEDKKPKRGAKPKARKHGRK